VTTTETLIVVAVGTACGLDLVSFPQMMLSRPIVAAFLGGLVVGGPVEGLAVGALLELFAMESLPVGAARYPDWGPPGAAAGALVGASRASASPSGMLAVLVVSILVAWLGGWLMHQVRRANGAAAHDRRASLASGDVRALNVLIGGGLLRDAARAFVLATFALTAGDYASVAFARAWQGPQDLARLAIVAATVGVALWSATRLFGQGRIKWFLLGGLAAGTLLTVVTR
jgi:mannose/fructose/N-acetylgalactosamine-specific phosphotransferase system component IIC